MDKNRLFYRLLNHKVSDVIFGVLLSNIAQVMLPYRFILGNITFKTYKSRFNIFIQVMFIGFFLILMSFMIGYYGIVNIIKNRKIYKKLIHKNKRFNL